MTVGELKKRIEDLGISDDADVCITYGSSSKDLVSYRPYCIAKTIHGNLKIIIYDKEVEEENNKYD